MIAAAQRSKAQFGALQIDMLGATQTVYIHIGKVRVYLFTNVEAGGNVLSRYCIFLLT